MRRVGLILVVIVVIGGAAFGAFRYGYQQGETSGQATASSDRTAFFGTRGALPAGGAASPGGRPGQGGTGVAPVRVAVLAVLRRRQVPEGAMAT